MPVWFDTNEDTIDWELFFEDNPQYLDTRKRFGPYAVTIIPLAANSTAIRTISIDKENDFLLTGFRSDTTATDNQTYDINAGLIVQLTNQATGRNFFNQPVEIGVIAATYTSSQAVGMTWPLIVPAQAQLTLTIESTIGNPVNLYFACQGVRVEL